jgi:hypothetical protein
LPRPISRTGGWRNYDSPLKPEHGDGVIVGARELRQLEEAPEGLKAGPLPQDAVQRIEAPLDNYLSSLLDEMGVDADHRQTYVGKYPIESATFDLMARWLRERKPDSDWPTLTRHRHADSMAPLKRSLFLCLAPSTKSLRLQPSAPPTTAHPSLP